LVADVRAFYKRDPSVDRAAGVLAAALAGLADA
jgi:hypothetical protein